MKMSLSFLLIFINIVLSLVAQADELKIASDPTDATVSIRDFGGTIVNKLGKTSYVGNIQELAGSYSKTGFFIVVIEKEGYLPQSIVLSDMLKSDLSLNFNLEPVQEFTKYKQVDKAINELFEAQRLIRSSQYDNAIEKLKALENSEKSLSIIPELIASTYYLKKDMTNALAWYRKAYRVNPENKDAFMMKSYLEKSLGTDDGKNK
jgi:tetratricopeptide (TPR) repeat protein